MRSDRASEVIANQHVWLNFSQLMIVLSMIVSVFFTKCQILRSIGRFPERNGLNSGTDTLDFDLWICDLPGRKECVNEQGSCRCARSLRRQRAAGRGLNHPGAVVPRWAHRAVGA